MAAAIGCAAADLVAASMAAGLTRVQTGGLIEIALAIVAAMHVLGAPRLLQTCARVPRAPVPGVGCRFVI